jgi:AraC-like DNA-binding protein
MRVFESVDLGIDPVTKVKRLDHYLTPSSPIHVRIATVDTTALDFDYHDGIEVGVLVSGCQERHWEGYTCDIEPGETWLVAMWEPHGWRAKVPGTGYVVVIFLPEFLDGTELADLPWLSIFATPPSQRPRITSDKQRKRMLDIAGSIREELEEDRPLWMTGLRIQVMRLLFELLRDQSLPGGARPGASLGNKLSQVMPALTMLRERGPRAVKVVEAARACNLSRTTLNRLFRESMGVSFAKFRMRAHLVHATQRLLTTDLPLDEIAKEAGFTDASHLHRSFVKHYGKTPGQFRTDTRQSESCERSGRVA